MKAQRLGMRTRRIAVCAYLACGVLSAVAGIAVAAQVSIGDATVGGNYTLLAIAAPVLGGASLLGGRGSFLGCLVGAIVLAVTQSLPQVLGISDAAGLPVHRPAHPGGAARLLVAPEPPWAAQEVDAGMRLSGFMFLDRSHHRARRAGPGARRPRVQRAVGARAPAHPDGATHAVRRTLYGGGDWRRCTSACSIPSSPSPPPRWRRRDCGSARASACSRCAMQW